MAKIIVLGAGLVGGVMARDLSKDHEVISVDISKRSKSFKKFLFPNKCPSCGSKVIKEYNYQTKRDS